MALDPQKFREQFAEAAARGDTEQPRQVLVVRCFDHGLELVQPEGAEAPLLVCPAHDCQVIVTVAVEDRLDTGAAC